MLWVLLCTSLFAIFTWRTTYEGADTFPQYCYRTFFFLCLVAFGAMSGVGFAMLVNLAVPKHWTGPETVQLATLSKDDKRFFLGTGSIGTVNYYFFYKEFRKGSRLEKIAAADNVRVVEREEEDGRIETYTFQFVNPWSHLIAMNLFNHHQRYRFLIPKGSIKQGFVP